MTTLRLLGLMLGLLSLSGAAAPVRAASYAETLMPALTVERGTDPAVVAYLNHLKGTALFAGVNAPGSFLYMHEWYAAHVPSKRISSRGLAIAVIVFGAALPLISVLDRVFKNQKLWVALIGAAIVVSQGMNQTFQSTETWENYTVAMLSLEQAHHLWQNRVLSAGLQRSGGLAAAQAATEAFSEQVAKIVLEETRGFFAAAKQVNRAPAGP